MGKTEVYSWRISPDIKAALESAARQERTSVAALLDRLAQEWLRARRSSSASEAAEQARLHAAAALSFGTIAGGRLRRAENVRSVVREKLARRRAG